MTCEAYLCTQVRDEFYWKYRTSNSTKRDRYVGKKIQASNDSKMFIFIRSVRIRFLCAIIRPLDCRVKSTSLAASQPRGNVTDIWNVAMCSSRIMNPPPPLSPLLAFRSFSSFPFVSFFLQKFSARVFRWRVAATRSRLFGPGPVFFFL